MKEKEIEACSKGIARETKRMMSVAKKVLGKEQVEARSEGIAWKKNKLKPVVKELIVSVRNICYGSIPSRGRDSDLVATAGVREARSD